MSKLQLTFVSFYIIAYFEIISTPKSHTLAPKKQLCHFKTEKDASHISMTHAFLYSYFKNLYFLCLLSVNNKISSEFQSLLEAVLLMEGRFYI